MDPDFAISIMSGHSKNNEGFFFQMEGPRTRASVSPGRFGETGKFVHKHITRKRPVI